jgi:hypothetical protein
MTRLKTDKRAKQAATEVQPEVQPNAQALQGNQAVQQQVAQVDAQPSAVDMLAGATDPKQEEKPESWDSLLGDVEKATTPEERQATALALATWARTNLTNQADIEAYLARTDVTPETKTAVIGQLQALLARNEFLLGTSFHGGVDQSWETTGSNAGPMMDYYLQQSKLDGQVARKDAAWCTSFVGTQALRAGFDAGDKALDRSMFWSGSRLEHWANTGQATSGKELNPKGDRVADSPTGGVTGANEWKGLGNALTAAEDDEGKQAAVDAFLKGHKAPQAGDIVVVGEGNAYHGKGNSHTLMVESFDPATGVMSLIEGNSDNRVKGRTIDLRDPDDVGKIIHITRLGAENFDDPGNKRTGAGPTAPADARQVTAEQLLAPVRQANSTIAALAVKNKWVKGTDPNASVSALYHGTETAKDDGGTTR